MQVVNNTNFMPRAQGVDLETGPECFGELTSSTAILEDPKALRERMEADGYLFFRGFFARESVLEVRRVVVERMAAAGYLEPGTDPMDAICRKDLDLKFQPDLAENNPALESVLYAGRMMDFYRSFFGEEVLHFDYTWFRAVGPGKGTKPHCDIVYMGRGTRDKLYTAWVPFGDVPVKVGGLMLLEGSHRQQDRLRSYLERDVDAYCKNRRHAAEIESGEKLWEWAGHLANNPAALRKKLGGRWLTTDFEAGDMITFPMHMVHASLDNPSDKVRLSTDSRYQPVSQPADERWIGPNPPGHSLAAKRGRIC